ncbi:MAG TPA: serine/threonine-protein kinase [Nannocystaceae bacterium]|nr:serine/threonine-protein kinase [Nannocystaceae bacterium]
MSTPGVRTASSTAVDPEEPGPELLPAALLADRYVMIERVGEGGMGQVWRAFDVKLERSVALKFVHEGAKSSRAQTRIVREARAMARLAHPNVLSVFDVVESEGMTGIVMELVTGCTLREWMQTEHPLREILAVFAAAARGLHAAHEAGFVHRDFKPANVLLADPQSAPAYARVRVMDFGLAREDSSQPPELVAGARVAASEALTAVGEVMGTPAYMAPEQRVGAVVDARSDQYSFCVSLHEAVLGTRPLRVEDPTAGLDDARVPAWLRALLRRGLQLDPGQRHASMAVIATTLEARAEGRRVTQLVTAGVVALAIATVGWSLQSRGVTEAARARCADEGAAIAEVWGDEQRRAVEASLSAVDVVYAGELFRRVAPWLDRWSDEWASLRTRVCVADTVEGASTVPALAAIDCLDERRIELAALVDQLAHADAGVAETAVSDAAGLPALAPCLDASMLALRPVLPDDETQRRAVLELRGELARVAASHSIGRADDLVAHARKLGDAPLVARALATRGHLGFETEDAATVEAVLDEAFHVAREARLDLVAAEAAIDLVFVTGRRRSEFDEGILWGDLASALLERSAGDDDPRWSSLHTNLGLVLLARGDHDSALVHMQRAVALTERTLGSAHPWLSTPLNNLGLALSARGDEHGAITQYQRSIAITEENLGIDHPEAAMTLHNLGDAYLGLEQPAEGRSYNERALAIWQRTLEPDHPNMAMAFNSMAHAHFAEGDRDAAIVDLERALQIWRSRLGPDDPAVGSGLNNLAVVYTQNGQPEQAERYYADALALRERVLDPLHVDIARSLSNFARFRFDNGRVDEAATMAARAVQIFERSGAGDPKELARALRIGADCARARGDNAGADAQLARAKDIERRSPTALAGD